LSVIENHRRPSVAAVNMATYREAVEMKAAASATQGPHHRAYHGSGLLPDPNFPPNTPSTSGYAQLSRNASGESKANANQPKHSKSPRQARKEGQSPASKRARSTAAVPGTNLVDKSSVHRRYCADINPMAPRLASAESSSISPSMYQAMSGLYRRFSNRCASKSSGSPSIC
jgi:hypothetical protein